MPLVRAKLTGDGAHVGRGCLHPTFIPPRNCKLQTDSAVDLLNLYRRAMALAMALAASGPLLFSRAREG